MFRRYFQAFDGRGWAAFIGSLLLFAGTMYITYLYLQTGLFILLFTVIGMDMSIKLLNLAAVGSIYRHREGKNREIYQGAPKYWESRFKAMQVVEEDWLNEGRPK